MAARSALLARTLGSSGPITNKTLVDAFAAEFGDASNDHYATINGPYDGHWQADSLPLYVDIYPTLPLPASHQDPNLDSAIDALMGEIESADNSVFLFLAPIGTRVRVLV